MGAGQLRGVRNRHVQLRHEVGGGAGTHAQPEEHRSLEATITMCVPQVAQGTVTAVSRGMAQCTQSSGVSRWCRVPSYQPEAAAQCFSGCGQALDASPSLSESVVGGEKVAPEVAFCIPATCALFLCLVVTGLVAHFPSPGQRGKVRERERESSHMRERAQLETPE